VHFTGEPVRLEKAAHPCIKAKAVGTETGFNKALKLDSASSYPRLKHVKPLA